MILSRCAALLVVCFLIAGNVPAQSPPPSSPFAGDERTARIVERYKAMLHSNPAEGVALDRLWKAYEERGATSVLIDEYHRAGEPSALIVYGHFLKRAGRLDEAADAYERAAKADPANTLPLVAQAELAAVRVHFAESAALYEQALTKVPAADRRRADLLSKLGDAWLAAGQPLKASEAWEQLVAADPANLALRRQLAANYERNGLPDRALVHYEYLDAHADPAGRAAALRELGRLREWRGDFDGARDALESGLALTARDNWLHGELQSQLIRLYQRAGRTPELDTRWQAALAQAPRDLGGYARLIALAEAQGDPAAARGWLEKLVALAPRDRENTLKLARLLADAGETVRAAALYDALLKFQPGNLDLILARADLDLRANQTGSAVGRIEERLAQNPNDESLSVPALQFFLSHRLDDAAERCLRAAAARHPAATEPALSLAKFYLARRRPGEARDVLETLARQPGDPAARAARWFAAADCYKDAGEPDEALRSWKEALALQPTSSAALLAIGESLLSMGDVEAGIEQIERALAAVPEGPAREEIDRKLFQALADRSASAQGTGDALPVRRREGTFVTDASGRTIMVGPVVSLVPPSRKGEGGVPVGPGRVLARYLARMEDAVRDKPTAAGYLRLARWLQWAHRLHEAATAAEAVLTLLPDNISAREILVENAISLHHREDATARSREIAALNPSRKSAALGRIADLLLEDGEYDGALAVLDDRVRDAPGSVDALSDLALGQQRADRWFDALATWERAYTLPRLTPAQRANLRRPLLAAHEHLGQFKRAAELLQAAIDAQDDLAARRDLFHELSGFCRSHSLMPWLSEVYQRRLGAQPQDYFAMTAMAELHKAAGETLESYGLLTRAYYSAPDPAAALRSLADEAEALGETTEAVAHQRRLVALAGQANLESLSRLAALEEADLDDGAAARTWEQIAARFPRDTVALGAAADHFAKGREIGRARELLTLVVGLDPGDFLRAYQLGQLDLLAGDQLGARACFQTILDHTASEKPSDPWQVPTEIDPSADASEFAVAAGRSVVRGRGGLEPTGESAVMDKDERSIRLKAIGELSRLLFAVNDPASADDRHRWLERWRTDASAGLRSEPLAAFYHADQKDAVAELTTSWMDAPRTGGSGDAEGIFLLAGLRMQNYAPLARRVWSDEDRGIGQRSSRLLEILQYFLTTGGQPSPDMVAGLFPAGVQSRPLLWRVATGVFAEKYWYPQAVELGERALASPGGSNASESYQLAQWEVDLGRPDAARKTLARALETGSGSAYDASSNNAVFADLRAYYFLLPAGERARFAADYLKGARARPGGMVHATLAAALLHGLEGHETEAYRELDKIVAMRLLDGREGSDRWSPDLRRWNYLFACGAQLQAWNLDNLAAHLWQRAMSEASAFDRQDPEVRGTLAEIRLRQLVAEELMAPDPQEAGERLEAFLHEGPSVISMASAASALVGVGQYPAAVRLYERLCRQLPTEGDYPRALLLALEAAGDRAAVDRVVTDLLDGTLPTGSASNRFEMVSRLAALREGVGDGEGALRLLLDARRQYPQAVAVLRTVAQLLERQNRLDDAAAILREAVRYDRGAASAAELASVEYRREDHEAAYRLVRDAKTPENESERAGLFGQRIHYYLATGHVREAVDLAAQWVRDGHSGGMVDAVSEFTSQGQRSAGRDLLADAVRSTRDPSARYQMQRGFVELFCTARDVPLEDFLREMRRLERCEQAVPGQRDQYVYDRYALAVARGANAWLENELKQGWQEGRGDIAAGEWLAKLYFQTKQWEPLRQLVAAIDARPNLPEQILHSLATQLVESGHAPLALPVTERLRRRFPQNVEYALLRARALWDSDHRPEAAGVLDATDAAGVFRPEAGGQTAGLWTALGEPARARASLEAVLARDPCAVRSAPTLVRLAALDLEEHRADDACRLLASAYRNPATSDMEPLVDALAAAGRLEIDLSGELPGTDLPLTFLRRTQLFAAVCERLQRDGREDKILLLAGTHPGLLAAMPHLAETLRLNTSGAQVPALVRIVEETIARAEFSSPSLARTLARLLLRSAEETQAGGVDATNLLVRAHELASDDFAVARALAANFHAQGQNVQAAELLNPYQGADALPSERDAARQVLGSK